VTTAADHADEQTADEGVSPRTAATLREAINRLLAGRPQRTDGRLVKDNLWKEAGLSRATMNRARLVIAEWDTQVADCDALTPGEARKNDELTHLRAKLADKTREYTILHHQLDAAATAIAALHHDNTLLRQESRPHRPNRLPRRSPRQALTAGEPHMNPLPTNRKSTRCSSTV
jgi:hypothetical protein